MMVSRDQVQKISPKGKPSTLISQVFLGGQKKPTMGLGRPFRGRGMDFGGRLGEEIFKP